MILAIPLALYAYGKRWPLLGLLAGLVGGYDIHLGQEPAWLFWVCSCLFGLLFGVMRP